ncbi:MAG: hypothetical protein LC687_05440 [Actinobacteria bacterium]|nr:hypothetical protein [Actinomycetota bacterium]MCA1807274.1 hypothetical protein [Actinomycetota bacterium]
MTPTDFMSYCYGRLQSNWSHTPIQYQDAQLLDHQNLDEFAKFGVYFNQIKEFGHGYPPSKTMRGMVTFEIYSRHGDGVGRKYELAELYVPIFDLVIENGITFYATDLIDKGNKISGETTIDQNWTSLHCLTDFYVGAE